MGGGTLKGPGAGRALLAAAAALLACLGSPALAAAAETTIGFDTLEAGEAVTTQYEGEGLRLGTAAALGFPGSAPTADCGGPTVAEEAAGTPAASPPNYAVVPACPSGRGTMGALLAHPRGTVSVDVRDLSPAAGVAINVALVGYDSAGKQIVEQKGEAITTAWKRLTIATSGEAKIAYFSLFATDAAQPGEIGIDDLSYEAPGGGSGGGGSGGGGSGGGGSGGGPTPPTPPTAALALAGPAPQPGSQLTLTGASSQSGSGRIVSYDWDFNGDGRIDTSTGSNPVAHLILAPGVHTIGLTVTSSTGQSSTTKLGVSVPPVNVVIPPADGGEGACMPTWEEGSARIVAECIQKLPGGGFVIASRQIDLNGMTLVPSGGGFGVFKIQTKKDFVIAGTQTLLSGSPVDVELLNTPIGDVVLGGRDLEGEPIQLTAHSSLGQTQVPYFHDMRARGRVAGEATSRTLLMAIGVGHECSGGESKKVGCCPRHENTACGTLPGDFPLTGQVVVYLNNKGQVLLDVQVGLALKGVFEATGALEIEADPQTGINLSSLKFEVPEAGLESIFTVKDASFVYYFPSAPEESKRDTWQAKGTIVFGPLGEPSLEGELAFQKGQFHSASLVFQAPPPGIPVYPGVALNKLGGSVGVEPFSFGGTLGASIATQLELTLSFKYREATNTELGFFGGQGKLTFKEDDIATLAADVYSDGYVDAKLAIDLHVPFSSSNPIVKVGGNIGFWDEPASGLWQAEGDVYLKLWEISAEVAGLVNNEYVAGCAEVAGFGVQGRYRFSDGNVGGSLFGFSNCSDQLKEYREKPLVKHSGGFVGEELRLPPAASALLASAGPGETFTLPRGQFAQELRLSAAAGTPVLTLTSPGGQAFTTPAAPGQIVTVPGRFVAAVAPQRNQVLVLLEHPQGGTWRVQEAPGSPALTKLEVAGDAPPARVRVNVRHRRGARWTLRYRIANHIAGTRVRFVERGRDSTHVLGTVGRAAGTISFTPQDAISRSRRIVAYLLNAEGAPQRVLTVGRYTAPAAARPARVRGVRIVRRGLTAVVSWPAARGARLYAVRVRGSDGRLQTLLGRRRSVTLANVLPFESFTVTVGARGGPNMLEGRSATARLKPLKPPRKRPGRGHRRRHG